MNLRLMLKKASEQFPDKDALTFGGHGVSYRQIYEESNRIASALMSIGITRGDRIAMLLSNRPEFVSIYFGIINIGGISVPLDTKYKTTELTALFNDCQPKLLIIESTLLSSISPVILGWKSIERIIEVGPGYTGRFLGYEEMVASGSVLPSDVEIMPEDTAHIAYTSGPALHPKGVMMSHRSLVTEAGISAAGFQQTDKDIVALFALPLHHAFGLVVVLFTSIYRGSTVAMLSGVSISSLMEMIEHEKVTMFMGVPFINTLAVNWAEEAGVKNDVSSLRLCGSAGASLPVDTAEKFQRYYGLPLVDFWGMTEASAHVTCQSADNLKPGSVGKALPGWELKTMDGKGRETLVNQTGEIIVRGPLMTGYFRNPQATAEAIRDGWLYTGDLGMIDDGGDLFLIGMKRDMINTKGQNIYPSDIEEVLQCHPEVMEAAVVGVPDILRGATIRAFVQLRPRAQATELELKRFCLEHLANYKVPKQFIFVGSLPRTENGEIFKDELRKGQVLF